MWPTTFLGRTREIERVRELFAGGDWLVTLLGVAGTGKTRLASRYADLHGGDAGVFDLTPSRDLPGLCAAVGRAFGVGVGASEPRVPPRNALRARGGGLAVLDNCAH